MPVLFLLLLLLPCWAEADTVRLDANESPPYWSRNLAGGGLGSELVQAISEASGVPTQIHFVPLSRMIEDRNNNDLGNPEFYMAQQEFAAIIPIAVSEVSLFYYLPMHRQAPKIDSFNDLKQYRIGVLKGTLIDKRTFKHMGLDFETSYSQASLFKKLKLGRIDIVFEIDLVGQQMIAQLFPEQQADFVRRALPNTVSPIAIMLDAEYPNAAEIAERYRRGLANIIADGRYENIVNRYYPDRKLPLNWFADLERFRQLYDY